MKTYIMIAVLVVGAFIIAPKQCSSTTDSKPEVVEETNPNPPVEQPTPTPTPTPSTPHPDDNPGWKYTGFEDGYWRYQPEDPTLSETTWFRIEDWNTTYALRDCVVELKKKDGSNPVRFRWDSANKKHYLEIYPGVFSEEVWTGYLENIMATSHVKFFKNSEPFNITVGRRKLDN